MMPTLSWLVVPEVVVTKTSGANNEDKVGIMTTRSFQKYQTSFFRHADRQDHGATMEVSTCRYSPPLSHREGHFEAELWRYLLQWFVVLRFDAEVLIGQHDVLAILHIRRRHDLSVTQHLPQVPDIGYGPPHNLFLALTSTFFSAR